MACLGAGVGTGSGLTSGIGSAGVDGEGGSGVGDGRGSGVGASSRVCAAMPGRCIAVGATGGNRVGEVSARSHPASAATASKNASRSICMTFETDVDARDCARSSTQNSSRLRCRDRIRDPPTACRRQAAHDLAHGRRGRSCTSTGAARISRGHANAAFATTRLVGDEDLLDQCADGGLHGADGRAARRVTRHDSRPALQGQAGSTRRRQARRASQS
jgi:hypothetical protein